MSILLIILTYSILIPITAVILIDSGPYLKTLMIIEVITGRRIPNKPFRCAICMSFWIAISMTFCHFSPSIYLLMSSFCSAYMANEFDKQYKKLF